MSPLPSGGGYSVSRQATAFVSSFSVWSCVIGLPLTMFPCDVYGIAQSISAFQSVRALGPSRCSSLLPGIENIFISMCFTVARGGNVSFQVLQCSCSLRRFAVPVPYTIDDIERCSNMGATRRTIAVVACVRIVLWCHWRGEGPMWVKFRAMYRL